MICEFCPILECLGCENALDLEQTSTCRSCTTPVKNYAGVGWRHVLGLKERGGCTAVRPR